MKNTKTDPRSAAKKLKDAAYAKLGPVRLLKPLRFIADNTERGEIHVAGKLVGYTPSPQSRRARIAADRGNGATVKRIAREVAAAA